MATDTGQHGRDPMQGSDLEYDLAHESDSPGATPPPGNETRDPIHVATQTPGYDGDYGYDLAHDVPGR